MSFGQKSILFLIVLVFCISNSYASTILNSTSKDFQVVNSTNSTILYINLVSITHGANNFTIYDYDVNFANNTTVRNDGQIKSKIVKTLPFWSGSGSTVSPNWAGYAAASSLTAPTKTVNGISGSWSIQEVPVTSNQFISNQWIGIGGIRSAPFSDTNIVQIGSESTSGSNSVNYYTWYELYPSGPVNITTICGTCAVSPNDKLYANITTTNVANQYELTLIDNNKLWDANVPFDCTNLPSYSVNNGLTFYGSSGSQGACIRANELGDALYGSGYSIDAYGSMNTAGRPSPDIGTALIGAGIAMENEIRGAYYDVYDQASGQYTNSISSSTGNIVMSLDLFNYTEADGFINYSYAGKQRITDAEYAPNYVSLACYQSGSNTCMQIQWIRVRTTPVNDIMPRATYSKIAP